MDGFVAGTEFLFWPSFLNGTFLEGDFENPKLSLSAKVDVVSRQFPKALTSAVVGGALGWRPLAQARLALELGKSLHDLRLVGDGLVVALAAETGF